MSRGYYEYTVTYHDEEFEGNEVQERSGVLWANSWTDAVEKIEVYYEGFGLLSIDVNGILSDICYEFEIHDLKGVADGL